MFTIELIFGIWIFIATLIGAILSGGYLLWVFISAAKKFAENPFIASVCVVITLTTVGSLGVTGILDWLLKALLATTGKLDYSYYFLTWKIYTIPGWVIAITIPFALWGLIKFVPAWLAFLAAQGEFEKSELEANRVTQLSKNQRAQVIEITQRTGSKWPF